LKKKCLDYAEKADGVNGLMSSDLLELSEPINCQKVEDVDNALKYLDKMEQEHKERKPTIDECKKFMMKLKNLKILEYFLLLDKKN